MEVSWWTCTLPSPSAGRVNTDVMVSGFLRVWRWCCCWCRSAP